MAIRPYLAMTGEEIAAFPEMPEKAAWMLCPFSGDLDHVLWQLPESPCLVLTDAVHSKSAAFEDLISKISALEPQWVLLDFQRKEDRAVAAFAESMRTSLPCPVAVSETYAYGKNTPVFLRPVPLHSRLCEYISPWQGREIWLDLSREGEKITLTKDGAKFESCTDLLPDGMIHQEQELHCHYTISLKDDSVVFTLWRTEKDLEDLLQESQSLGIQNAIGLYQEWQGSGVPTFW